MQHGQRRENADEDCDKKTTQKKKRWMGTREWSCNWDCLSSREWEQRTKQARTQKHMASEGVSEGAGE